MRQELMLLLFAISTTVTSQNITIEAVSSPETNFEKALRSIDNIRFYDFKFVNRTNIQSPKYKIVLSEYINGNRTKQTVFAETNPKFPATNFENNDLPFIIMAKYEDDSTYKILFRVGNMMNYIRTFDVSKEDLFDLKMLTGLGREFENGKKQLFCAVVKPIKTDENTYRDCDFNSALDKYEDWYEVFGLDKYYIFELVFEQ